MNQHPASHASHIAFTLVELLVVITIIVMLLALLAPAIDRAIYQAEMAVCATRLKGIGTGATLYAMEFARRYPHRRVIREHDFVKPNTLRDQANDVPVLQGHFDINGAFNCPFTRDVDWEASQPNTILEVDYQLWFGWRWRFNGTHKGMDRIGDQFSYTEGGVKHTWDYLASDVDFQFDGDPGALNTHPDHEGTMVPQVVQDGPTFVLPIPVYTLTRWVIEGTHRGRVDQNYMVTDGSVGRIVDLTHQEWDPANARGRMMKTPGTVNGFNYPNWWNNLPRP